MRKLLNPAVALLTFFVGVFAVTAWLSVSRPPQTKSENAAVSVHVELIPPPPSRETESRAVYSALLREMFVHDNIELLVIEQQAGCWTPSEDKRVEELRESTEKHAVKKLPNLESETLADFRARVGECLPVGMDLDVPVKYALITDREQELLFPKGDSEGWKRFYARYPKSSGIIGLSTVGFNREMNQALVVTSRGCGWLCGAGHYVLLTKEGGVWKVHSKTMTWVS